MINSLLNSKKFSDQIEKYCYNMIAYSILLQCAVKLQKIMQEKVQELLEFDQVIRCINWTQ